MVKVYISRKGISFTERNVSLNSADKEALLDLGRSSIPVTRIGNISVVGYKPKDIDTALSAAGLRDGFGLERSAVVRSTPLRATCIG